MSKLGSSRRTAQIVDYGVSRDVHAKMYATIANLPQPKLCDIRDCDIRIAALDAPMDGEEIKLELHRRGLSQRDLAEAIGMDENHLSKALNGKREFKVREMDAIRAELAPDPDDPEKLAIRSIPLLGDVPAGSFQPQEQRGGRRMIVTDPDVPARAYGLTIVGDSMDLIVANGSKVIIDPDDKKLWPGARYVIRTADGQTTFKEYQDGPARLVPCSSNHIHAEILLGEEQITIEGRVFSYEMRDVPRRKA